MGWVRADTVAAWLAESKVPAAGIGIIEKRVLRRTRVYGKLQANLPAPDGTLFNVASLTKPVVAILALVLVSRKQWNLDEPLAGYWVDPDVKGDSLHKKITTRHVLSQQSGFPNWRWDQPAQKLTFKAAPGTRFGYSGEGFEYLKRALEARFGKPLEQLADSVLFKPLAMPDIQFYWRGPADTSRFAFAHDKQGKRYQIPAPTEASAADDLLTTVGDYGRFCAQLLQGIGFSAEIFRKMTTPRP
jgi:CubicO group peptidase (beta-lactamase class C family)